MLTIGTRPPPTCSASQRYGPRFHGSPVVVIARSEERSASGSPLRDQRAHERGRDAEHRHPLGLDEPPEPVGGPVGRALRVDDGRSGRARADHGPRPHDPAHVGREVDAVARVEVGLVGRPRARSRRGSRPGRGARPSAGRSCPRCTRAGTAPPSRPRTGSTAPVRPATSSSQKTSRPGVIGDVRAEPPPHDDVLHGRHLAQRLVGDLLHRHDLAAAQRPVRRDQRLRARVGEPRGDRRGREPGEDRHLHRAEVRERVRGDRDLGRHRQEDPDEVALADPERREPLREPVHLRARARPTRARAARRPPAATPPPRPRARPSGGRSSTRG